MSCEFIHTNGGFFRCNSWRECQFIVKPRWGLVIRAHLCHLPFLSPNSSFLILNS